ncbi:MAG: hypothetical protein HQM08_01380 [Candidatus Riflebacteria bacterium]|nr:hypothetical protein [Candidatus Riflebacteria bacterium]
MFFSLNRKWLAIILLLNCLIDYRLNQDYYFSEIATNDCRQLACIAKTSIGYITALDVLEKKARSCTDMTDCFYKYCELLFNLMMESPEVREKAFVKPDSALHVGIYFSKDGILFPSFRYYDVGITLRNRTFKRGESYVGVAFNLLEDKSADEALHYASRQDGDVYRTKEIESDRTNFNSGIMANINVKYGGDKKSVGILNFTSSQRNCFIEAVHNPVYINIATRVSKYIQENIQESQLPAFIDAVTKTPFLLEVKKS